MSKRLNWKGVETCTTDTHYDILEGYFDNEIECEFTKDKLNEARNTIKSLIKHLEENDLVA